MPNQITAADIEWMNKQVTRSRSTPKRRKKTSLFPMRKWKITPDGEESFTTMSRYPKHREKHEMLTCRGKTGTIELVEEYHDV